MENYSGKVFTEPKDFPFELLKSMIEEGDINPQPDYQREFVYKPNQSARIIESAILGIPIPPVFLCQEDDESYSVIDGQQRILSIKKFLGNEYRLVGLSELKELNEKYFRDLDKATQRLIKSKTIHAICILKESQNLKYEIFARLNKGSVKLKPQELRNCIYRGSFNQMLDELAENKNLPKMFFATNCRKQYQENILRFFALQDFMHYKSSLNRTLNEYMEKNREMPQDQIEENKKLFGKTIDIVKQILGDKAFAVVDHETGELQEKFSATVYDSIVIPFSFYSNHDLIKSADIIRKKIELVRKTDLEYRENIYAATGSRARVVGRIMTVYNLLKDITGSCGNDDTNRIFTDDIKKKLFKPGYICSYCNNVILSIDDAEVDHSLAYNHGGKTDISNAQLLHRHCNREKSDSIYSQIDEDEDE